MFKKRLIRLLGFGLLVGLASLAAIVVGRAREDARREHCLNNLKGIGLGFANYHTVWDSFPFAASPNDRLPPEKRLGWQITLVPYMVCPHCCGLDDYSQIDFSGPWDVGPQSRFAVLPLYLLICPSSPDQPAQGTQSFTHPLDRSKLVDDVSTAYIGIAGVGKDAASYPAGDPRAGVFGYGRVTRLQDIKDGTSSTMVVVETSETRSPWTSGGPATVRGLDPSRQPYIGRGRQFGGLHRGGVTVLLADGSTRFVSETIDPKVFEALSTIAGGEALPAGWDR
jgi:hypothetical protein